MQSDALENVQFIVNTARDTSETVLFYAYCSCYHCSKNAKTPQEALTNFNKLAPFRLT